MQDLDTDISFQELQEIISATAESATKPLRSMDGRTFRVSQPWWDAECTSKSKERKRLFLSFRRTLDRNTYIQYQRCNAEFKRLVKLKKRSSWQQFCDSLDSHSSLSKTWRMAKKFKGNAASMSGPKVDWDKYGDLYMSSLAPPLNMEERICVTMEEDQNDSFSMSELEMALNKRRSTSPGLDGITFAMLSALPLVFRLRLLKLYNSLLHGEDYPREWRDIELILIPKPGKPPNEMKSYRPIALISCMRKLFELMLKNRLEHFVESNNLFPPNLCGFRKGKCTMDVLGSLIADVRDAYAKKQYLDCCFLDIEAAYDNVRIKMLVDIMLDLNVPKYLVRAIHELFVEKCLVLVTDSGQIIRRNAWIGLPQGSCLSPICFNIYLLSILRTTPGRVKIISYADDLSFYVRSEKGQTALIC